PSGQFPGGVSRRARRAVGLAPGRRFARIDCRGDHLLGRLRRGFTDHPPIPPDQLELARVPVPPPRWGGQGAKGHGGAHAVGPPGWDPTWFLERPGAWIEGPEDGGPDAADLRADNPHLPEPLPGRLRPWHSHSAGEARVGVMVTPDRGRRNQVRKRR